MVLLLTNTISFYYLFLYTLFHQIIAEYGYSREGLNHDEKKENFNDTLFDSILLKESIKVKTTENDPSETIVSDIPSDFRVKYYMKDAYDNKVYIPNNVYSKNNFTINIDKDLKNEFKNNFHVYKSNLFSLKTIKTKHYKSYIIDMQYVLSLLDKTHKKNIFN